MLVPACPPDEPTLREFLLGKLSPENAERVEAWLSSDSSSVEACRTLKADDLLTGILADVSAVEPGSTIDIEQIIRSVFHALGTADTLPAASVATSSGDPGLPPLSDFRASSLSHLPPKLGHYRVIREIGRGGMGVVYEAKDETLQRRVAIKVMALNRTKNAQTKARFLREARAAAAVEHENVVPVHHIEEEGEVLCLVMPLLRGESLEARLQREGQLPAAELIRLGRDVAAGLVAAHARGLVHRDIKPANVWLDADSGKAKILDFGLARATDGTDGLTAPNAIPGTPAYMAPEQVDGLPLDARADLFSLGAMLYRCATGRLAFAGPTMTAIMRAVTAHQPLPPQQVNPMVPAPLSDLIMWLLAKAPSARPQSAEKVINALAVCSDYPAAPRRCRGRWVVVIAAVVAAATLLAAIGGWHITHLPGHGTIQEPSPNDNPPTRVQYRGQVDVLIERADQDGKVRLLRLNQAGALPLRKSDKFRIEGRVDPPAYLYVVWVDPGHDVTPVYPWDPTIEDEEAMWKSRPAKEEKVGHVRLPRNPAKPFYRAPDAKPGVATMVLFARPTPLDVPDEEVRAWFKNLPDLPLPAGGEQAVVWFDNYLEVRDQDRPRTFGEVGSEDAFTRWQGQLQKVLGDKAAFQTAASFARTGGK